MIHVVIAEDDYRIGNIHEQFLQKVDNFHVVGKALNGEEVLDFVRGPKQVDLLLLDIYMPDILGTEVMREIRKSNKKIDIIVISAATEKEIIEDVILLGAFDYILKPVKLDRFVQTLTRYKEMKQNLESVNVIDQSFLDNYFGQGQSTELDEDHMPKGIDPITLKKTKEVTLKNSTGLTADDVGKMIGVSRTTARRYLEYLMSEEKLVAELEYGSIGRPERYYFAAKE